ncbi:kinase-like domain-containing protein [Lentinula aciculospora]|uniref:Kinase-like domain-containing protein n=1 Tax=Lentinula aciculospora TaxID=153920 RepID=A0A9W9DV58_9AGAR|nr:kinase-like domain-containing protein [Lentinula aciculospora]
MPSRDLANTEDLKEYLQNTPFASSGVDVLTGGTGNFACRLHLIARYQDQWTLVLKHAKPYVFTSATKFPFALERQKYEVEALSIVRASVPESSFVTVPKVHFFDEKESIIIMDGRLWEREPTIGSELGAFLRQVHSTLDRKQHPTVCDVFEGNVEGKRISAWATYGQLVSTLAELNALSPTLDVGDEDMKVISEAAKKTSALIFEARDTFVMGDFWPGNILLSFDSNTGVLNKINVIDWELSKTGLPGLDLGQFTAEMDLLRRFYPSFKVAGTKMLSAFYGVYSAEEDIAQMAALHWGAHLIAWTPRVPWGSREETREMVAKGIKLIVAGPKSLMNDLLLE